MEQHWNDPSQQANIPQRGGVVALEEAAAILHNSDICGGNIVFLSDARSVLRALQRPRNGQRGQLGSLLQPLGQLAGQVILRWLPGRCSLSGDERADHLAKEGTALEQLDNGCSHIKAASRRRWRSAHPNYNPDDPIHTLPHKQQTMVFGLRAGRNRLNQRV